MIEKFVYQISNEGSPVLKDLSDDKPLLFATFFHFFLDIDFQNHDCHICMPFFCRHFNLEIMGKMNGAKSMKTMCPSSDFQKEYFYKFMAFIVKNIYFTAMYKGVGGQTK